MKQQFTDMMEQKRTENELMQEIEAYRDMLKQTRGYVSTTDSVSERALQAIIDPLGIGGQVKDMENFNTIELGHSFEDTASKGKSHKASEMK